MKLLKSLVFTTAAFAAYTDTCNGASSASNCDGTCSAPVETCQGGSGLIVSDLACCSNADTDFVCSTNDNKCADLPVAIMNSISCCSGANPTVPGIPTDAPVEPTANPTTMSSSMESTMSSSMESTMSSSSSETSTEAVVTDENGVTVTEGKS